MLTQAMTVTCLLATVPHTETTAALLLQGESALDRSGQLPASEGDTRGARLVVGTLDTNQVAEGGLCMWGGVYMVVCIWWCVYGGVYIVVGMWRCICLYWPNRHKSYRKIMHTQPVVYNQLHTTTSHTPRNRDWCCHQRS